MRDYVSELRHTGLTLSKLAESTGMSTKKLSNLSRGLIPLKSTSKEYATLRNLSRKTAYNIMKESGMTAKQSSTYRRIALSETPYEKESIRHVKHTYIDKNMFQLKLLAEYVNIKEKRRAIMESTSYAHATIPDEQTLINEAVNKARWELGATNWELKRIIHKEIITYQIG